MTPVQTFEYKSIKIELFEKARKELIHKVYLENILVKEDNTYTPSPLYSFSDPEITAGLLDFFTAQAWNTDDETLEKTTTPEILEWSECSPDAEELRKLLWHYENRHSRKYLDIHNLTLKEASKIEDYIVVHYPDRYFKYYH